MSIKTDPHMCVLHSHPPNCAHLGPKLSVPHLLDTVPMTRPCQGISLQLPCNYPGALLTPCVPVPAMIAPHCIPASWSDTELHLTSLLLVQAVQLLSCVTRANDVIWFCKKQRMWSEVHKTCVKSKVFPDTECIVLSQSLLVTHVTRA